MARWLIIAGSILIVVGLVLHYVPGIFGWFGRLPGDIRIETERGKFFFPITSAVLISILLTVVINLFRR